MGDARNLKDVLKRAQQATEDAPDCGPEPDRIDQLERCGVLRFVTDRMAGALRANRLAETAALAATRDWLSGSLPVLCLLGTVGRGKTIAAAWLLGEIGGHYIRARELADIFSARDWEARRRRDALLESRLVVVDDLGTERALKEASEAITELVDGRQSMRTRTVLITNLTMQSLADRMDARTVSRLKANAHFHVDAGDDMRRRGSLNEATDRNAHKVLGSTAQPGPEEKV